MLGSKNMDTSQGLAGSIMVITDAVFVLLQGGKSPSGEQFSDSVRLRVKYQSTDGEMSWTEHYGCGSVQLSDKDGKPLTNLKPGQLTDDSGTKSQYVINKDGVLQKLHQSSGAMKFFVALEEGGWNPEKAPDTPADTKKAQISLVFDIPDPDKKDKKGRPRGTYYPDRVIKHPWESGQGTSPEATNAAKEALAKIKTLKSDITAAEISTFVMGNLAALDITAVEAIPVIQGIAALSSDEFAGVA